VTCTYLAWGHIYLPAWGHIHIAAWGHIHLPAWDHMHLPAGGHIHLSAYNHIHLPAWNHIHLPFWDHMHLPAWVHMHLYLPGSHALKHFFAETKSLWSQEPVTRDFRMNSIFKHFTVYSARDEIVSAYAQPSMKYVLRMLSQR